MPPLVPTRRQAADWEKVVGPQTGVVQEWRSAWSLALEGIEAAWYVNVVLVVSRQTDYSKAEKKSMQPVEKHFDGSRACPMMRRPLPSSVKGDLPQLLGGAVELVLHTRVCRPDRRSSSVKKRTTALRSLPRGSLFSLRPPRQLLCCGVRRAA